jgi:predicted metal-dependent hydrolase
MIHFGENVLDGIPVEVTRRRAWRIGIRVLQDGRIAVTVPKWGGTLREAEAFLRSKWDWVVKTRAKVLANPAPVPASVPPSSGEVESLRTLLADLNSRWAAKLGEKGVTWTLRAMKTLWGSCHVVRRRITYNTELAKVPREMVEYVVVHELTHLKTARHGPKFYRLMDERLPGWRELRRRLNKREFRIVQSEFAFDI